MRGAFRYWQSSVTFPNGPFDAPFIYDELTVLFQSRDGGTYAEFRLQFCEFGSSGDWVGGDGRFAVHLSCYGDALNALHDARVKRVLERWRRWPRSAAELTPEKFIVWLEEEGARPHIDHIAGLRDRETERTAANEPELEAWTDVTDDVIGSVNDVTLDLDGMTFTATLATAAMVNLRDQLDERATAW